MKRELQCKFITNGFSRLLHPGNVIKLTGVLAEM